MIAEDSHVFHIRHSQQMSEHLQKAMKRQTQRWSPCRNIVKQLRDDLEVISCASQPFTDTGVAQVCTAPSYKSVSKQESTRNSNLDIHVALGSTWYTPDTPHGHS